MRGETIFLSGQGTKGDMYPLLSLAGQLRQRGATVIFLVNDHYKPLVEGLGFEHGSTGRASSHVDFVNDPRTWDATEDVGALAWPSLTKPAIIASFEYVKEWCANSDRRPIVLGIQPAANGALWAAEALQLPAVHILLAPNVILSRLEPPAPLKWSVPSYLPADERISFTESLLEQEERRLLRKPFILELEEMRRQYHLAPLVDLSINAIFSPSFSHVALWPDWFAPPAPDWPKNMALSDFPMFSEDRRDARAAVDRFIQQFGPPVVLTFGTGVHDTKSLLSPIIDAQRQLDCPMIFVGGNAGEAISSDVGPSLHVDFAQFEYLFPKAKLVIHHGGIGTLAQAVRAGTPQLIRPTSFDQFDNAARVRDLHLGDYLLPNEFLAQRIVNKIRALEVSVNIRKSIDEKRSAAPKQGPFDAVQEAILGELRRKGGLI